MTAKNDITGDTIATKSNSDLYRSGWERIFGRRQENKEPEQPTNSSEQTQPCKDQQQPL